MLSNMLGSKNMTEKDWNNLLDTALPDVEKEMDASPFDTKLSFNMADDARKVINENLNIKDFHKKYHSKLLKEFGEEVGQDFASGADEPAQETDGVKWGMVIDLRKCVGCDTCTVSCKAENRTPPGISYNVVLEQEIGDFPNVAKVNLPRPCMQCEKPSCVQVCPTRATYKLKNGIVTIDNDRCIGCRYCIVACPYGARSFDFGESYEDEMPGYNDVTSPEYGIERGERKPGKTPIGTVRKCNFCLHRLERGEEPACVETCVGDARFFGDLNDPNSTVSKLSKSPRAFRLKSDLGNGPNVIYLK
ncbi:prokaryotic molybdopterin-containing oxidoreductase family, iron-sulfur binding subunit [Thalassobacillus cyri]|uniref:Prokaryotic molybdopterin-containing oxidoreductase family, iron-sulfur binding subunit n=1 Tax=Thalassobacillus cyri TaxID=571932 RepID=A0A1H4F7R1_9BACI|nr:4Fe-4S dicluster domain-containing protein [Thalassobacillus cyri]SEA92532.1 prokaryotic molybdopterin-containing oxidoreductase family, iron-sulfur binding subunit [Thalassobacillus cyri]